MKISVSKELLSYNCVHVWTRARAPLTMSERLTSVLCKSDSAGMLHAVMSLFHLAAHKYRPVLLCPTMCPVTIHTSDACSTLALGACTPSRQNNEQPATERRQKSKLFQHQSIWSRAPSPARTGSDTRGQARGPSHLVRTR